MRLLPQKLNHDLKFRLMKSTNTFVPWSHSSLMNVKEKKFISISLFMANLSGNEDEIDHIYLMGMLQNLELQKYVYKDWKIIVYIDKTSLTVYPELMNKYLDIILQKYKVIIVEVNLRTNLSPSTSDKISKKYGVMANRWRNGNNWDLAGLSSLLGTSKDTPIQFIKTAWRFLLAGSVSVFICRDVDARINIREESAINEWLSTNYSICRIFDNDSHANPLLAGMWGGKRECNKIVHSHNEFKTCRSGDYPIPDIHKTLLQFISDKTVFFKGYGVDEMFLGNIDDELISNYYEKVITFGKGGYFPGENSSSLLTDKNGFKVGHNMLILTPANYPDDVKGTHQSFKAFTLGKDGKPILGKQCALVGGDIILESKVSHNIINWIIHETTHSEKSSHSDFNSVTKVKKLFLKFHIELDPTEFKNDLYILTIAEFTSKYYFDKRNLPQFWYTFTSGISEDIPFFGVNNDFVPNKYELSVYEFAIRESLKETIKYRPEMLGYIIFRSDSKEHLNEIIVYLSGDDPSIIILNNKTKSIRFTDFFRLIKTYVTTHSRVYQLLGDDMVLRYDFWQALVLTYPLDAIIKLSLDF